MTVIIRDPLSLIMKKHLKVSTSANGHLEIICAAVCGVYVSINASVIISTNEGCE